MVRGLRSAAFAKTEMPSWTREGHSCRRVKARHLCRGIYGSKTSTRIASLRGVTPEIPTHSALIEWILYGIHARPVRIVSNLNQKIKLLHIVAVNCLFLLLRLLSAPAIYFTTSVEIKIIVELMQPQESNYIAIIPFGCRLIEVVIFSRNMSCCVLKGGRMSVVCWGTCRQPSILSKFNRISLQSRYCFCRISEFKLRLDFRFNYTS